MVQFYPWFKFYFPLFQTCYHTLQYTKTKEKKILTKDKIEPQHLCQLFGSLEKSTILFELSNFTHQLWCLCKPNRLYHSCHMKGKNIIWWSLALLNFSWDRSLLLTKSWYSRSCFSGRSRRVGWVGFRSLSIRSDKFLKESFLKCGITYYFLKNIFT